MVRSSGSGSYIGIDGESLVWQIQLAEMNYVWNAKDHQIRFNAGINEDFWVKTNNEIWGLREISWGVAERQLSQSRADTGMSILYNYKMIQAGVRMSSGEGMRRFERNTGFNTEGIFAIHSSHLRLELYARDGSAGPSFAPNHRLGGRISTKMSDVTLAWCRGSEKLWDSRRCRKNTILWFCLCFVSANIISFMGVWSCRYPS